MTGHEIRALIDRARCDARRVSDKAFRVLHSLVRRVDSAGWVRGWPVEAMASELICSTRTIGCALTQLDQLGYIKRRLLGNGFPAAYRILTATQSVSVSSPSREPKNPSLPPAEEKDSSAPITPSIREREEKDLPEGDLSPPIRSSLGEEEHFESVEERGASRQAEARAAEMEDFQQLMGLGFFGKACGKAKGLLDAIPSATPSRVALTFLCVTTIHGGSPMGEEFPAEFENALCRGDIDDPGVRGELCKRIASMRARPETGTTRMEREPGALLERCLGRVFREEKDHEQAA